jgi:hypothetical protein
MIDSFYRQSVQLLAQRMDGAVTDIDKAAIRRHAEGIYNIAHKHDNRLAVKLQRRESFRSPDRQRWVAERFDWKLIQDDCLLICEILEGLGTDS